MNPQREKIRCDIHASKIKTIEKSRKLESGSFYTKTELICLTKFGNLDSHTY